MDQSLAFVFPGQGSQSMGMLSDMVAEHPLITETFAEASAVLDMDLWQLACEGPEDVLNRTDNTQPVLLAASVALWRVWLEQGGDQPLYMAGHSLGEYSALVCAGALAFKDAMRLVQQRGRFMQEAMPAGEGAMAAIIGLSDKDIQTVCAEAAAGEVVAAANFNLPGQVVIAGHVAAVDRAVVLCQERGAKKAVRLAVSVPSHCELMRPAAEQLAATLKKIKIARPEIPVVQNVCARTVSEPAEIRDNLVKQLYRPVRWVDCVKFMLDRGVEHMIECGPGKVLSGLNKRIAADLTVSAIGTVSGLTKALND